MKDYNFEEIYYTLLGEMDGRYVLPGVENAYAPDEECDRLYTEIIAARDRLRDRLGVSDEDPDLECILDNSLTIQRILCEKMFRYGQLLGQ